MSPEAVTAESVYRSLRVEIFSGRVMAHTVLNLNMIADALGVSVSPVRDAMERLVGERILAIRPGGGFQLPRLGEDGARDLYLWHAFLVRSRRSPSRGLRAGEELLRWIDRVADGDGHGIVAATA